MVNTSLRTICVNVSNVNNSLTTSCHSNATININLTVLSKVSVRRNVTVTIPVNTLYLNLVPIAAVINGLVRIPLVGTTGRNSIGGCGHLI